MLEEEVVVKAGDGRDGARERASEREMDISGRHLSSFFFPGLYLPPFLFLNFFRSTFRSFSPRFFLFATVQHQHRLSLTLVKATSRIVIGIPSGWGGSGFYFYISALRFSLYERQRRFVCLFLIMEKFRGGEMGYRFPYKGEAFCNNNNSTHNIIIIIITIV